MTRPATTDEQRMEILRAYASLKNIGRVANLLGYGYGRVRAVLQEAGVEYGVPREQQPYRRRVHPQKEG